ncbi:MAG TPA: ATP-dependent sacrificial sulfur transferase LarE [Clostridia bacterium]|nr:ATP-dependent sacrificial sulfur transferase LarE [Clostridia bacterium]
MDLKTKFSAVPRALREILEGIPKAALGFSGGVDSSYLLYAAKVCSVDIRGYYASSQFQPQFELDDARKVAQQVGAEMEVISLDVLSNNIVRENPADRCYHCKGVIFSAILDRAAADGYSVLMDGSNASDDADDRPGMRALSELKVLSPLRESGLTKDQIREYSKQAGLFTWDKPAYACLATRIPTDTPLDAETLCKVEQAENKLFEMGFTDFRARVMGNAAKLQMPQGQILRAARRHSELVEALSPWFEDVLLDLKPR